MSCPSFFMRSMIVAYRMAFNETIRLFYFFHQTMKFHHAQV